MQNWWLVVSGLLLSVGMHGMDDYGHTFAQRSFQAASISQRRLISEADRMIADPELRLAFEYERERAWSLLRTYIYGIIGGWRIFESIKTSGWHVVSLIHCGLSDGQMADIIHFFPPRASSCVHHLLLRHNALTTLPASLRMLSQLTFLDFSYNDMHLFPLEACCLERLEVLKAAHNPFEQIPQELCMLLALRALDLSYTDITQVPSWIINLTNLRALYLQRTFITSLPRLPDSLEVLVVDRPVDTSCVHPSVHIIRV